MKKISIAMVLALIISTVTSVPFASMAAISGDPYTDNPLCIFSYDGTGSATGVPALNVTSGTPVSTSIDIKAYQTYGKKDSDGNTKTGVIANFVESAPQKAETDKTLHMDIVGSTSTGTSSPAFIINASPLIKGSTAYTYLTYEFDALFCTDTSSVSVRWNYDYSANLLASEKAIGYSGNLVSYGKSAVYTSAGINKWHKVRFVFPIGNTSDTIKVYLDDMSAPVATTNAAVSGSNINGSSISSTDAHYEMAFSVKDGNVQDTYVDNINIYVGSARSNTYSAPVITSVGNAVKSFDNTAKTLTVIGSSSLTADVLAASVNTDAVYKAVYKSDDLLTAREGAVAEGDKLVLANADGVYSYYTINFMDVSDLYKDAGNITVTSTGTNASAVTDGKTVVVSSKESDKSNTSSAYPFAAKATFASPMDISSLGNVYTISFDVKHEFTDNVTSGMYVGQNYLADIWLDIGGSAKNIMAIFGNGNGIKIGGVSGTACGYNGTKEALSTANKRIIGMNLGEAYRFQFVVDKNNSKLYFVINDQYIADVSAYYARFTGSAVNGLTVNMRGGSGTVEYVKLTLGNFKAVSGFGDLQINNPEISVSGVNASVQYDAVNLTGVAYNAKLVAAAYDNSGILIAAKVEDVVLSDGYNLSVQQDITFDESTSASAKSYRAFFLNTFDDLKPLGSSEVYAVE